ncbi:MAG: c-type cytochrome [Limnohabitans sp.]
MRQAVLQATADKAGWQSHTQPQQQAAQGEWLQGQGIAYARYTHSKWPGFGAAWAAWVADVQVHRTTGEVQVKRVVVGHDAGRVINPRGVAQQVHGNVLQTTSRALMENIQTDASDGRVTTAEWGAYPILNFKQVPLIEVVQMPRPLQDPLGAGESSSVPGTAAIANAIFDATGVRFRQPPFTPEVVRAALHPLQAPTAPVPDITPETTKPPRSAQPGLAISWGRRFAQIGGVLLATLAVVTTWVGVRSALPRVLPVSNAFSDAQISRGAELAALGNCISCHTADQGLSMAGGKPFVTPYGTVYSTNLSPDPETGMGTWSYQAFARAMREGVSRDGHALYPVFPFTSFARLGDEDMTALYAWLMSQPPVVNHTPAAEMWGGMNLRPLLSVWNSMFHQDRQERYDSSQTALWNRGEYLVNGVAHCGACHTSRNGLGAEQKSTGYLQGAFVDDWYAPALTDVNASPMPWRAKDFFNYLRHGFSGFHGTASGPMAQVVRNLQTVSDDDVKAMAVYFASLNPKAASLDDADFGARASAVVTQAAEKAPPPDAAARQFAGSCGACHHEGDGPQLLGVNQPLALNSNLHSDSPANLVKVILHGVQQPASRQIGFMPAFENSLSQAQIVSLVKWMRQRFAPGKPAWSDAAINKELP